MIPMIILLIEDESDRDFKYIYFLHMALLSILLLFGSGCSQNKGFNKIMSEVDDFPVFLAIDVAKEEIKTFTYGSHGWIFENPYGTSFIYAWFGNHIIRYDMRENAIDRIVKLSDSWDSSIDRALSFSPTGNHAIVYESSLSSDSELSNIFLIDFKNCAFELLAEKQKDLFVKNLPENLRENFIIDQYYLGWNNNRLNFQNLDKLNYTIEQKHTSDTGYYWVVTDESGNAYELTVLKGNLNGLGLNSIPCVAIDSETIGALLPLNESRKEELGYYRFALISLKAGKIIQECSISTHP